MGFCRSLQGMGPDIEGTESINGRTSRQSHGPKDSLAAAKGHG